jgi:hypothetical protein
MPITKDGVEIKSLSDWEKRAPPKSPVHWQDGRSAKETARCWLAGGDRLPPEVSATLESHPAFGPVLSWSAEPEAKLRFDSFSGEPRNSDLVVDAHDAHGHYLIAVEAKADETFGASVAKTLMAAQARLKENPRSKGVERVRNLVSVLLGVPSPGHPKAEGIRYQLLTACAGAICEAERRGCSRALMLVHEFVTDQTTDAGHRHNAWDLDQFLQRISRDTIAGIHPGEIQGPLTGAPLLDGSVRLYIGKAVRNLRR